ncbi:M42 family metallopeptidase [Roseospira navarrensis]|uniref:M20/M25/M40 family metallo-hydrolase n=1 Tax=Roseospira navarrensis TaxID=140058 RepID=A0A7X2D4M6_9PROT|nr:M20/M25/M40 family metallo-hydrolase [Roseospira navarrensis]MQX38093.1 M20/M25/M40 family metallo-hydrolase [Roseospira navarrensis]
MIEPESVALLETLVSTPGVPGREDRIRAVIRAEVERRGLVDDLRVDALGSLIGVRHPRPRGTPASDAKTVLAAAHMDTIGFLVAHVSDAGMLRLHPVGAFDPRTLVAQRVTVCTEQGADLPGLLMLEGPPLHTAPEESLSTLPKLSALYVDTGLPGPAAREAIRPGDMVVLAAPFRDLGAAVAGPGLDNRVGCWALIEAMSRLEHHDATIQAVWSSQEELGSRGVEPVSFGIAADIGICCDTSVCADVPGVSEEQHITTQGRGVALQVADSSTLADMGLVRQAERLARTRDIPCQRSLMLGGGQDGAMIQRSREGVRTLVMSGPVRHMHTANEMAHKTDLDAYRRLLGAVLGAV